VGTGTLTGSEIVAVAEDGVPIVYADDGWIVAMTVSRPSVVASTRAVIVKLALVWPAGMVAPGVLSK
jgi:hypothetical protein